MEWHSMSQATLEPASASVFGESIWGDDDEHQHPSPRNERVPLDISVHGAGQHQEEPVGRFEAPARRQVARFPSTIFLTK